MGLGFQVWGLGGFRVSGLGCGLGISGLGVGGFRVSGLGCKV